MQQALGIVIFVVVALAAIVAVITVIGTGRVYDQIGRGGLAPQAGPETEAGAREAEIRQMLGARNARRVRRGEAPLDVEDELAALNRTTADPALADEVRELVVARNARRVRRGEEPLDVETEVARRLRELAD